MMIILKNELPDGFNKCIKKFNPYAICIENGKKNSLMRRSSTLGDRKNLEDRRKRSIQTLRSFKSSRHTGNWVMNISLSQRRLVAKSRANDLHRLLWSLSVFIRSSVIWERVHNFQLGIESYQQKINLTAPTITLTGIKEYDVFSIVYEPVHGIIYTNSKKEKRVMRHSEIHKFCDATLRRTLEGLKRYYNNVKYGYVQKELTNDDVEYLKLFEEEIEVQFNYRDQMRRWEMHVNGRPLGPRRERPE
ncbi:hypothetical protein Tco_1498926 [Tanacetum coccineum]